MDKVDIIDVAVMVLWLAFLFGTPATLLAASILEKVGG